MNHAPAPETIFAPATALARSGVAIIRISGPDSRSALTQLTGHAAFEPNLARLVDFRTPHGEVIDRGLVLFFAGPHSFTGEDVAELHLHGSLSVIREMLALLAAMPGLRPAEPGEFTRRAFLNGKMDLTQAEGLADLIEAETPRQRAQAIRQLHGEAGIFFTQLRAQMVHALAQLEAYIDFPDEEIPPAVLDSVTQEIEALKTTISAILADQRRGERLRDGIRIVIIGAPNSGKSSLLNKLSGKDAAIVSHRAGTTRDVIEVHLNLAGFPVILTDTAGLRESADEIEEEGIKRARAQAELADIKLVLFDASQLPQLDPESREMLGEGSIAILTKIDLAPHAQSGLPGAISISTKTGEGIEALLAHLEKKVTAFFTADSAPLITRTRHRALLENAQSALNRYQPAMPLELACEELRTSATAIGKITGKIQVDELLDVVFRQFCIGK